MPPNALRHDATSPSGFVTIGNIYGHGFDASQIAMLQAAGFALRPAASVYAGSQLCRFLDFEQGPPVELIEVTNRADYESFVPPGMTPYCPGISLLAGTGSLLALDDCAREFEDLHPYRLEVPYEGTDGPGWHYLNFAVPVLPGAFVWLTSLDAPPPAAERITEHPNRTRGVIGVVFSCREAALARLAQLAGVRPGPRPLDIGGVTLTATGRGETSSRRFPLTAVVLKADSLEEFPVGQPSPLATGVLGRPALRLETSPDAFDLWITT
jgi:hypothetical protein